MLMTLWISRSDCPSRHDNDESIHPDSSPASGVSRVPAGNRGCPQDSLYFIEINFLLQASDFYSLFRFQQFVDFRWILNNFHGID